MGLYLCIFDEHNEIDGVEIGSYSDFNALREYVVKELEEGKAGHRFPNFVLHSDSDGVWEWEECTALHDELRGIMFEMKSRPAISFVSEWQDRVAKFVGLRPNNAFECFIDVDGEFVLDRIDALALLAIARGLPILFQ